MDIYGLVCPVTKRPLTQISNGLLSTEDGLVGYPIHDQFPILLGPEAITERPLWPRDLQAPQYAEAYKEMEFYNEAGREQARQITSIASLEMHSSHGIRHLAVLSKLTAAERSSFPYPSNVWLYSAIDVAAERDCYRHIGSVMGKRVMQIGGSGIFAIMAILAGAAEAILLTPMEGEAAVANKIAVLLGFGDRLRCIIGIAEEIPLQDGYIDACFVGGCVHHMRTEVAFAEISRVLSPSGKFAAIEPWRAPGYTIGTKLFGKREANAFCSPLDKPRVAPLFDMFSDAKVIQHGSLSRYPAIVALKAGISLPIPKAEWVADIDDTICNCIPFARKMGSGVALLATK
ncbi:Methyltransferase domain-containing protein [Bradyrhizobium erythrophlei]|nr:Methyltransferase domain-containing protein [Bradyrhizobium erythrophlei]